MDSRATSWQGNAKCNKPRRSENMQYFREGLESSWGVTELAAMHKDASDGTARVLAVRHGMGRNNDLRGALSLFNRDACLNAVGHAQGAALGEALESRGVTAVLDFVVVSPFVRALETASALLGERGLCIPTIVQPLCAEHTLLRSAVQQGDRGSTASQLTRQFPREQFPQFDFAPLEDYCSERGLEGGRWWTHGSGTWHETREAFAGRCREFVRWLGAECGRRGARRVLLVTHGGLLREGFGWRHPMNGECRAIDVGEDGAFGFPTVHAEGPAGSPSVSPPQGIGDPPISVDFPRREYVSCDDGHGDSSDSNYSDDVADFEICSASVVLAEVESYKGPCPL